MKKYIVLVFAALLLASCGTDSVEGNPEYLTSRQISLEVASGVWMFFWDNEDGTVSVTYDHSNPMHVNINKGTSNDYYKGSLTIPSTITHDGKTLTVTGITESAFMNCSQLSALTIPSTVRHIGEMAFYNCSQLQQLVIPEGVTVIESNCFQKSGLTNIYLPESLSRLYPQAFCGCAHLKEITIPRNITTLEDSVFADCTSLITAWLPETMTSLGKGTFAGCRSLVELTIPQSVRQIGTGCFFSFSTNGEANWKNLTLNVLSSEPPILTGSISNAVSRRRVVVPRGCREAYLAAPYWNEFTQILETNF